MTNRISAFIGARDWRIWLGLVVTVLWLGASTRYGVTLDPGVAAAGSCRDTE
jgi:hypothetical protein